MKHLCAPTCNSVQIELGANPPETFFGLDPVRARYAALRCGRHWVACRPTANCFAYTPIVSDLTRVFEVV